VLPNKTKATHHPNGRRLLCEVLDCIANSLQDCWSPARLESGGALSCGLHDRPDQLLERGHVPIDQGVEQPDLLVEAHREVVEEHRVPLRGP